MTNLLVISAQVLLALSHLASPVVENPPTQVEIAVTQEIVEFEVGKPELIVDLPAKVEVDKPAEKPAALVIPVKPNVTTQDAVEAVKIAAREFGVDENIMLEIAACESGYRENAQNGPYAGIFQFTSGTWVSNRRAMGLDVSPDLRFSAKESARTAAYKMSRDGFGAWPACSKKALVLAQKSSL